MLLPQLVAALGLGFFALDASALPKHQESEAAPTAPAVATPRFGLPWEQPPIGMPPPPLLQPTPPPPPPPADPNYDLCCSVLRLAGSQFPALGEIFCHAPPPPPPPPVSAPPPPPPPPVSAPQTLAPPATTTARHGYDFEPASPTTTTTTTTSPAYKGKEKEHKDAATPTPTPTAIPLDDPSRLVPPPLGDGPILPRAPIDLGLGGLGPVVSDVLGLGMQCAGWATSLDKACGCLMQGRPDDGP